MKEYKVINYKGGLSKSNEKLEKSLNEYASQGWILKYTDWQTYRLIFERDKNQ